MKGKIRLHQSINSKIVLVFVLLLVFALQLIGANFITQLERQLVNRYQEDKQTQISFLESTLEPYLDTHANEENEDSATNAEEEIQSLLIDFSGSGITEIQVIDADSVIVATSDRTQQSVIGRLSEDVDIHQAMLLEDTVKRQVIDPITNTRRWKIVMPVIKEGSPDALLGAVSLESNIETVYEQISQITLIFFNSSLIAIVLSLILANMVARALTTPIKEMKSRTLAIAEGNYTGKLKPRGNDELGQLTLSINDLSNRVSEAQEFIDSERRRLDSVLAHMTDGVLSADRKGKVAVINEMARTMLSISNEEALDKPMLDILSLSEEMTFRELLERQEDILIPVENDHGASLLLRASFSLIQRDSGFISGIVCVLHDVTEQERIEQERKEFVSNVSHELRTPLTSMRSYLEALNDGAWQDPEIAPKFLDVTQNETDRMIRMIEDLLHLSRMDTGKSDLNMEIVNLNELVEHVLSRFEMMVTSSDYAGKHYIIKREIQSEPVWAEVDTDRIIQVLDNIMNNAVKYSPDGGVITGRMEVRGKTVLISISDQGMGIPKEDLRKVFSRFYRVDRARSRAMGGSGLGLAISKEVIEQHDGTIWAESREGIGTTFNISLPYESFEEDEWE